jgi:hypothetical protein
MANDPAKELDELAEAYEEAAARLRLAAKSVRAALSGARQATLQIDVPAATEVRQVEIREVPLSETYKGKSQGEAAEDYINSLGRPVDKAELSTALSARGVKVGSKEALSVALSRRPGLDYLKGQGWATQTVLLRLTKQSLMQSKPPQKKP